jgi:hypothetical protein
MSESVQIIFRNVIHGGLLLRIFCYLALLTISFDIFLVIPAGFNIRVSQLLLTAPMVVVLADGVRRGKIHVPLGTQWLVMWCLIVLAFIPNTTFLARSLGYGAWLVFNILMIFVFVRLFDTWDTCRRLITWYLITFALIAGFGLLQFALPLFGLPAPLVQQWWFPDTLARINGFSYEPSYFATYLIIGWIICASLLDSKETLSFFKRRNLLGVFLVLTVALLLCSSRMGWIIMAMWFVRYPLLFIKRMTSGWLNLRYLWRSIIICLVIWAGVVLVVDKIGSDKMLFLVEGIGLFETSPHSTTTRTSEFKDTLQLFLDSPFIGYSLGGIAPALGNERGVRVDSFELAKENEGMSVFAETLAASGVLGFVPFVVYIGVLFVKPLKLASSATDPEKRAVVTSLVYALFFELLILQMNQNILRPYLWSHIAILSCTYRVVRKTVVDNAHH